MNSYRKVLPIISLIKPLEPESGWWSSAVGLEWQGCVRAKLSVTWKPVTFDTSLHLSQSPTSSPAPGNSHSFTGSYELQVKKIHLSTLETLQNLYEDVLIIDGQPNLSSGCQVLGHLKFVSQICAERRKGHYKKPLCDISLNIIKSVHH